MTFLEGIGQDIRYAIRTLRKNFPFAATAVITLSLGIGGSTTMFTVIQSVLLRPLAYRDADRLVRIPPGSTIGRYEELKAALRPSVEVGAYLGTFGNVSLAGKDGPEVVRQARVSSNFLRVLGVEPVAGRGFQADDEASVTSPAAIISAELWRHRFADDPAVIGRTVILDAVPYTIIGVLPSGFSFPSTGLDVWVTPPLPFTGTPPATLLNSPVLSVFGRLAPQVSMAQANAEFVLFNTRYATAHPEMLDARPSSPPLSLTPLKDQLVGNVRAMLWMLFGAASLVLMIGCANVAGLLLARATSRSREFAVRASLGASRRRIVRQLLVESLVLALAGGTLGLSLARSGLNVITTMTSFSLPRAGEIRLDTIAVTFASLISITTGFVFGLAPAISVSRVDLTEMLKRTSAAASFPNSARMVRWLGARGLLVTGQVALSVILLIGATLLMESISRLHRVNSGFNAQNVLAMQIALPPLRYETEQKRRSFFDELIQRLHATPGIESAAVSTTLPMTPWIGRPLQVSGRQPLKLSERPQAVQQNITSEYFHTLEIPLRRGREFTARDSLNTPLVVIISESLARLFWPEYPAGQNPVGQHLLLGIDPRPFEIVGIVTDARLQAPESEFRPSIYIPYGQGQSPGAAAFTIRTSDEPARMAATVRNIVRTIDPDQAITGVRTLEDIVEGTFGQRRLVMTLLELFAGVAAILALVGIYGMIAYSVAQRRREVGVRIALGAGRQDIFRLLLRRGVAVAVLGVSLGLAGALAVTRVLKAFLFQISPADPITYGTVALVFVIVAMVAAYVPVRRATRIDPIIELRQD